MKSYYSGLDVLGAVAVLPRKLTAAQAAQQALASGRPVVTRPAPAAKSAAAKTTSTPKPATTPKTPAKVSTEVKKSTQLRAASAAKHANATAAKLAKFKHPLAKNMSGLLKKHASNLTTKATKIKGMAEVLGDDTAVNDVSADSGITDQMAQAGDIATQILPIVDKLYTAGKSDLAHEGETMVNAANYIIITLDQMQRSMTGGGSM
jgi:hypothetical protein